MISDVVVLSCFLGLAQFDTSDRLADLLDPHSDLHEEAASTKTLQWTAPNPMNSHGQLLFMTPNPHEFIGEIAIRDPTPHELI